MSEPYDPAPARAEVPPASELPNASELPTASELQRAIASVTGVETAVVTPTEGGRDRLRISLRSGEDPQAVAWSVAATLRERFGIALDPAAITTRTRTDAADEPPPPDDGPPPVLAPDTDVAPPARATGRPQRAAIRELTAHPDGTSLEVAATLGLAGRESVGRARGVRTRRGRWRAIAEATLDALDGLTTNRVRGHVDHVTVLTSADLSHVSVTVTLLTERGEETLLGAALVRDDTDRAVMRAALDAVNRRVEPWLGDPPAEAG